MKKKHTLTGILLSACLMTFGASAIADQHKEKINPWQHCGIGAGLFDDNGTAAAISNIIWDSGTTAVTSATASPETCSSKLLDMALFIDETYDVLSIETAMGEGKHLAVAMNLVGCQAAAEDAVIGMLRVDLQRLTARADYTTMDHAQKAYSYYTSLVNAASSVDGCVGI